MFFSLNPSTKKKRKKREGGERGGGQKEWLVQLSQDLVYFMNGLLHVLDVGQFRFLWA